MWSCCSVFRVAAFAVLTLGFPKLCTAQQTYVLEPDRDTISINSKLSLSIRPAAAGPASVKWPDDQMQWMFVRVGSMQQNLDTLAPLKQGGLNASLLLEDFGTASIGMNLKPLQVSRTGSEWASWLTQNTTSRAPESLLPARVQIEHVHSLQTLVQVLGPDGRKGPGETATAKTSLEVEIRPLIDPTGATVGSSLPVRVYVDGAKVVGAKVRASNAQTGRAQVAISDPEGFCHFVLDSPGKWQIEFAHAEAIEGKQGAAWNLWTGTLSFVVPSGGDR